MNSLVFPMPFRTSTIAWLVFCMFWLGFVYPRSHSGWIRPIGEIGEPAVVEQPTYRYSIPLPMTCIQYLGIGLLSSCMPFRTSTIAWLGFCMFWLGFVYPRSHPGWIGPIGGFTGAVFIRQQAYRYSIPLPPDLPSILRHRLAFLSQIVPVR